MPKVGRPKTKHEFDETIETQLVKRIVDNEYETAKTNRQSDNDDFEKYIDLIEGQRVEKDYDWMSDIRLPEFFSHIVTQSSLDVSQYFQTRDFVEVYIQDEGDEALANADATKELINRTLNQRHIYHYLKFVRAKTMNNIGGFVYAECRWEQETKQDVVDIKQNVVELDVDDYGNEIIDREIQVPATEIVPEPIMGAVPVVDRFNYDIYDPRNVFTDNRYAYSLQDKQFVTLRSEKTLEGLKDEADREGYFNLHLLEEQKTSPSGETETSRATDNKDKGENRETYIGMKWFDKLKRYGKDWAIVTKRNENGVPIKAKPGIDSNGKPLDNAEFIELVMVFALADSRKTLIGYHPTPYLDAKNVPYKPILRGICYVHPTYDAGMGDGKSCRDLQTGIDDTFNISNDRVQLATLPTLKVNKFDAEDNPSIYFEPQHAIELNDVENLQEFKISDNIQGALNQIQMLKGSMDQVMGVFPTTMGALPAEASTTATAVAGAESKSNIRTNYKSMTFEYTFLTELYWMIQQMTWRFAFPQTGEQLMGQKVSAFNPTRDYTFKPLSQSIETEQAKAQKITRWNQLMSYVVQIQHPDTVKAFNYIFGKTAELMGDEYTNFARAFLDPRIPIQPKGGSPEGAGGIEGASNQYRIPMSSGEGAAREGAYAGY